MTLFSQFWDRVREAPEQIKALDLSEDGKQKMKKAWAYKQTWNAFLDEHAPLPDNTPG